MTDHEHSLPRFGLSRPNHATIFTATAVGLIWLLAILAVDPRGEFPTIDDWAYRVSVVQLVEHGKLVFSDWTATNLLSNALWGALFGTSYEALRLSTLAAATLGAISFFIAARRLSGTLGYAAYATIIILLNPLSFGLSFSFMTDVPYAAVQTGAIALLLLGTLRDDQRLTAAGWALAIVAMLSRPIAICIPAAMSLEALCRKPIAWRRAMFFSAVTVGFFVLQLSYTRLLDYYGIKPLLFGRQTDGVVAQALRHPVAVLHDFYWMALASVSYIGLFTLPVTAPMVWLRRSSRIMAGLATAMLVAFHALRGQLFPFWYDFLNLEGFGSDVGDVTAPRAVPIVMTLLVSLGAALLLVTLLQAWRRPAEEPSGPFSPARFSIIVAVVLLGFIVAVPGPMKFDRYIIPMIGPILLAIAVPARVLSWSSSAHRVAALFAVGLAGASITGTHDMVVAQRSRLQADRDLRRFVPPDVIDAGWVINAARFYGVYGDRRSPYNHYRRALYRITIGTPSSPRYAPIARYSVDRWLPWDWHRKEVVVSRLTQ